MNCDYRKKILNSSFFIPSNFLIFNHTALSWSFYATGDFLNKVPSATWASPPPPF